MASQTFDEAMKHPQTMTLTAPDGREIQGFYCDPKLDRDTLPEGYYAYDIRHDDDGCGIFVELCCNYVFVNSAGTFFTQTPIPELAVPGSSLDFAIDEEEWKMTHWDEDTDGEYDEMAAYHGPECPVNQDTDWHYTF